MSGAGIRRTAYYTQVPWGRLALAAGAALLVIGATVWFVPSWVASKPAAAPAPSPVRPVAPTPERANGGGGEGGGDAPTAGPTSSSDASGLVPAPAAVRAAVVAGVAALAPWSVDSVLVAESDPSWAVAHFAVLAGGRGLFVLAHQAAGSWRAVESGYPQMPCDETVPSGVHADLGLLMASCG